MLAWARRTGIIDHFETRLLLSNRGYQIPIAELSAHLGRSRTTLFGLRAAAERRLREAVTAGDAPYEVLRCRYLDHGQLAVTPAHRDVARGLLALAYHQAHTHTLVVEPDAPARAGLSRLFPARQGRPHREDHPG